jgi:hypothetical protein
MYIGLHVKYSQFFLDFNETWIFSSDLKKKTTQISNFMKIRPVGAELFHAEKTDRHDEANSLFLQFCESA